MFVVPLHRLVDFIKDPLIDSPINGERVIVKKLVQRITVRIATDEANGHDLHHLFKSTNVPYINIELWIGGPINEMDFATQQVGAHWLLWDLCEYPQGGDWQLGLRSLTVLGYTSSRRGGGDKRGSDLFLRGARVNWDCEMDRHAAGTFR